MHKEGVESEGVHEREWRVKGCTRRDWRVKGVRGGSGESRGA